MHKRQILPSILAGSIISSVWTPTLSLRCQWVIVVYSRLVVGVNTAATILGLNCLKDKRWYVNESKRGYDTAKLLGDFGILLLKPFNNRSINPPWLANSAPVRLELLVVKATSTVEKPEKQFRGAIACCAISGVNRQVVVRNAGISSRNHA